MACRTEMVGTTSYRYCPDDLPLRADRIQAIMKARFIDELTGNPVAAQLDVDSQTINVSARAGSDAVAGLLANPARRFPGLASNAIALDLTVSCRRYVTRSLLADLGPFNTGLGYPADFPDYFTAIDLGDVALHRQATVISGRCVHADGINRTPLSNVSVELTGLWHRFPEAHEDAVAIMETPYIVSLTQGLYGERLAGTDQVCHRSLLPQAGEEKVLLQTAAVGASQLQLSNRVNLAAGQVLGIETDHSEQVEYLEITAIEGASTETQPAIVSLAYPVQKRHREGVSVVRVNPQAPGSSNSFAREAIPGDQSIFLDALTDITDSTVEISGGGAAEYHRVHLYSVLSDADGYFNLPPISRVAMMQLRAIHGGPLADVETIFSPDYEQIGNTLDLVFS
jgi:hypothetical protein